MYGKNGREIMDEELKKKIDEGYDLPPKQFKTIDGIAAEIGLDSETFHCDAGAHTIGLGGLRLQCLKLAYESIYKLDASTPTEWARLTDDQKKAVLEGLFALADKNWEWLNKE
jgi:hypothetical protein